ncbi:VOC family protein [Streptomyces nojiriensis]|uniref:VOC family protein n=1 Tax=Streptomyces nojiriensis TaxID=66374 RepID=UPI0036DCF745
MILELAVIYTTRLDACRDFYRGIGLDLVRERHGSGPEHYAATLTDGGVLELYPAAARPETGYLRLGLTAPPNGAGFLPPGRHTLTDPDGRTVVLTVGEARPGRVPPEPRTGGRTRSADVAARASNGGPVPPEGRTGVTYAEIAEHYGMSARYLSENPRWGRHPGWPAAIGKRGRTIEFDPQAIARFFGEHHTREATPLEPSRHYTVVEIAEASGLQPDSIRSDISRGRWPAPDEMDGDRKLWRGETVATHLAGRRIYRNKPK